MTTAFLTIVWYVIVGTVLGAIISALPSLHIYNVAGIALMIWAQAEGIIPYEAVGPFFLSLVVAYTFMNTIPMTLIGAPDESASVTILPNQKYLLSSRGVEAVEITGIGSLLGVFLLCLITPLLLLIMPLLHAILSPHLHWIIMAVIAYMLMSEWPKGEGLGKTTFQRFKHAWHNVFAGLLTFGLAALLGLIVTSRTIVDPEAGFQNIMPVFIGLFAIPGALQHLLSREKIPPQHIPKTVDLAPSDIGPSVLQGTIAGLLAAYIPAVTAGIGSIIAGHVVARRGDKLFIVSGGIAKVFYYVGSFLFLYLVTPISPRGISRGGLSMILKPVMQPTAHELLMMVAVILFAGCIAYLGLSPIARQTVRLIGSYDYRILYWITLPILSFLVFIVTGFAGLGMMLVASCIGSIPVFYSCRRSNCMAALLVPIALNMAGYGPDVLAFLGLE